MYAWFTFVRSLAPNIVPKAYQEWSLITEAGVSPENQCWNIVLLKFNHKHLCNFVIASDSIKKKNYFLGEDFIPEAFLYSETENWSWWRSVQDLAKISFIFHQFHSPCLLQNYRFPSEFFTITTYNPNLFVFNFNKLFFCLKDLSSSLLNIPLCVGIECVCFPSNLCHLILRPSRRL